jgi:F-type H+-transporting ATPase subunit b
VITAPNLSLLLIMACFWLVYWLVATQLVRPLGRLLDERARRIGEAHDTLTAVETRFPDAMTRCERDLGQAAAEAQKERAVLRAAGETARRGRLDAARAEGQQRLATLATELDAASRSARTQLREQGVGLAHDLAEQLLGRRLAS